MSDRTSMRTPIAFRQLPSQFPTQSSALIDLASEDDDGIEIIELPDDSISPAGTLGAYTRRGWDDGIRRGFRDAATLLSSSAEELIADEGLGDIPPSVIRQVVSALSARLARHRPPEPFVEDGLGI